jgi:hypothetical protein
MVRPRAFADLPVVLPTKFEFALPEREDAKSVFSLCAAAQQAHYGDAGLCAGSKRPRCRR